MANLVEDYRFSELEREGEAMAANRSASNDVEPKRKRLKATPFSWPDPTKIPRRPWLFGRWLLRGELTALIAPGGVGKSTFTTAIALSLASGRVFLDKELPEGAATVWSWNLEDGREELDRQVSAASLHYGVGEIECYPRFYSDSGLDQGLCTAIDGPDGFKICEPVYEDLKAELEQRKIDLLIVDPFVSSHEIDENANALIDKVAKRWKKLAHQTNSAIVLVHHTKKMGGREVKAEDSRGAVALVNAARSTLVLNGMTTEEAERFGITEKDQRRLYVRIEDDKPNRAPPEKAWWMKLVSVSLGNGDSLHPSDHVGAATHWTPPDPFEGLNLRHLYDAQQLIGAGEYGANVQANDWAGHAVAQIIGADLDEAKDKARVKAVLHQWKFNGAFKEELRAVPGKGRDRPVLVVGEPVDPSQFPTSSSGVGSVEIWGERSTKDTTPPPPLYRGGCGGGGDLANANGEVVT